MEAIRRLSVSVVALATALAGSGTASAQMELVYGAWTPPRVYENAVVFPEVFKNIEKETNGAIKWKLVAGGQLADGKATFGAVRDNVMQAGIGIATYVPNIVPSLYLIYSTLLFGHNDVVAATGAASETFYLNCPSCIEEFNRMDAVPLATWDSSSYVLACREPVRTVAEMKGKRVRVTGGYVEMIKVAGGVPVSATLVEGLSLIQRGGIDCQLGVADWLRTVGYADFAKYVLDHPLGISGPAIGFMLNRNAWNKFTPEQKRIHMKYAAWAAAKVSIGMFLESNEESLKWAVKEKGAQLLQTDGKDWEAVVATYKKIEHERNTATGVQFGVKNPGAIGDKYEQLVPRWRALSKDIGRDVDKFTEVLIREVYSKIDLGKL